MHLICKLGDYGQEVVEFEPTEHLSVLLDRLKLRDKNTKFVYNGRTYSIYSNLTFQEIGVIKDNTAIFINNQAISG